jgi:Fe-S cluster biosynthesis and repair protein YggX
MNTAKQQDGYNQKVLEYINKPENAQFKQSIFESIPQDMRDETQRKKTILINAKKEIRNTGIRLR